MRRSDEVAAGGPVLREVSAGDTLSGNMDGLLLESKFRTITDALPQMVWSTRADGWHDYYNRQWYVFTGMPEGATDGEGWSGMFHPDDQAGAWERWRHSLATGADYEIEYRLRHRSGEYRWVLGRALPLRDAAGHIVRWMGTCTDIHEQKMAQVALQRSEASLRAADQRKDEFLAMLAHELRNPLAPISTASELLRIANGDPKQSVRAVDIIFRQVRHMTDLVNDLLDVSRVTRGLVKLELRVVDFKACIRAAIEQARPLFESRGHTLHADLPDEPLGVRGDQTRLIQIVSNILGNAAKYTPRGGRVELSVRRVGEQVRVSVRDNGEGIAPALLPHIFELFTQAERSPDRSQGGLGIGLALVKNLVALHGGEVGVASEGVGCGSTFTVTLPAAREQAATPATEAAREQAGAAGRCVVIVDDNADAALTLATLLEAYGHQVLTFHSGETLLASEQGLAADTFILDIGLPGITGTELARRLREGRTGAGARLFALSGYGQENVRDASREAGFDAHFVKPVDPGVLLQAIAA